MYTCYVQMLCTLSFAGRRTEQHAIMQIKILAIHSTNVELFWKNCVCDAVYVYLVPALGVLGTHLTWFHFKGREVNAVQNIGVHSSQRPL